MRILHYCAHSGGFIYDWHLYHMIDELRFAGHEVIYCNPVEIMGRSGSAQEYSQVLRDEVERLLKDGAIDLFFGTIIDATLLPEAIDDLRARGIVTVNLSTDDYSHPFRVRKVAGHFDVNWSTVRENLDIIRGYGANVIMMPWGANPRVFAPVQVPEDRVIGFMGTTYGARARNIAVLQQADVPVRVHGTAPDIFYKSSSRVNNPLSRAIGNFSESWQRVRDGVGFSAGRACISSVIWRSVLELFGSLPEKQLDNSKVEYLPGPRFEDFSRCISAMALSLGSIELCSTYVYRKPLLFIRLREFEVAMSGGVHLVNRFPELEEYFEPDREMLYYDSLEELVDKARFYLQADQDKARQRIREQARARSLSDHTWLSRFRRIGDQVGLSF
ncbi:MAG TPA: glycosyltransferase family 1 protein [Gammaproteobacteria bacterium]|nr:glycosyltransferase family 1 protein [Gammaproteobacteria bacterium]